MLLVPLFFGAIIFAALGILHGADGTSPRLTYWVTFFSIVAFALSVILAPIMIFMVGVATGQHYKEITFNVAGSETSVDISTQAGVDLTPVNVKHTYKAPDINYTYREGTIPPLQYSGETLLPNLLQAIVLFLYPAFYYGGWLLGSYLSENDEVVIIDTTALLPFKSGDQVELSGEAVLVRPLGEVPFTGAFKKIVTPKIETKIVAFTPPKEESVPLTSVTEITELLRREYYENLHRSLSKLREIK